MRVFKNFLYNKLKEIKFRQKCNILFKKYSEYTMVPKDLYMTNLKISYQFKSIPGDIVECGVWKGGMVAGISELIGNKKAFLFDSFEGLPKAQDIDGKNALVWQNDTYGKYYFDNCTADEHYALQAMALSGIEFESKKGWFEDTLNDSLSISSISILRLDADWYDSTLVCLKFLFPKVTKGGVIIIDDYFAWDGCSRAVHFYLNSINSISRIQSLGGVAFIRKLD